jgi:hypothetical protein
LIEHANYLAAYFHQMLQMAQDELGVVDIMVGELRETKAQIARATELQQLFTIVMVHLAQLAPQMNNFLTGMGTGLLGPEFEYIFRDQSLCGLSVPGEQCPTKFAAAQGCYRLSEALYVFTFKAVATSASIQVLELDPFDIVGQSDDPSKVCFHQYSGSR